MYWQTHRLYEFGPFRVDAREKRLLRDGEVVPLRPKIFDLLLVLVQNPGHILGKDEMMKLIWPNTAVEEGNLARNVSTLRSVLGERPQDHRYIETIPWRGYRFVAKVREVSDRPAGPAIDSIAVLPFVTADKSARRDFLSDGLTESLITSLAHLTHLRVVSRNSAFRYKGREVDAQTIGRELKVQSVLMGRVAESDDLVSISIELVDTRDDQHLWGAQYIRQPADLYSAQETIAREIAEKLRCQLSTDEKQLLTRRHTQNNDAYVCYLKGRFHFNKLTLAGVQKAVDYFQQAVETDPNFALAYAGLADCHNYLAQREEAKQAVLKALELDDTLGEAHASLGFFRFLYDWDFPGAEQEFSRALDLSPNYAEAHHWYAIYLANLGRHEEAEPHATMAIERDPLSLLMNMTPALNFYLARKYDRAVEGLHKVIELEPNFVAARSVLGSVLVQTGRFEEAIAEYEKVFELIKGAPAVETSVKTLIAHAYAKSGQHAEAMKLLNEVIGTKPASSYTVAAVYAAAGERDSALEWLNKACEQRDFQLVSLKVDPRLDGLRSDSRFAALLRRVGLPH